MVWNTLNWKSFAGFFFGIFLETLGLQTELYMQPCDLGHKIACRVTKLHDCFELNRAGLGSGVEGMGSNRPQHQAPGRLVYLGVAQCGLG